MMQFSPMDAIAGLGRAMPTATSGAPDLTADQLAAMLVRLAAGESVRVIEALAATIMNGLYRDQDLDHPFPLCRLVLEEASGALSKDELDQPIFVICQRIARRAVKGSLVDHTYGATAFHRLEFMPNWAAGMLPVSMLGGFLFYRM